MRYSLWYNTILIAAVFFPRAGAAADCLADPAWFPGGIPNPPAVNPLLPLPPGAPDCDFYKWAWQTFLYVTYAEGADQQPRFVNYIAPLDLFANKAPLTLTLANRKKGSLNLMPRGAKSASASTVDDVLQATSKGLIVDHSGRAVYYGTHLNDVFEKFVRRNGFDADVTKIGTFDAGTPVDPGSVELKSSWKILDPAVDDADQFFTIEADIPSLKVVTDAMGKKHIETDFQHPRHETLALVGLHIVGTVKDHPEFIWATFEHVRNAPGLVGQKVDNDDAVDASSDFTFYDLGVKRSECNQNARDMLTLDVTTQKLTPVTQVFRQFRYGSPDNPMTNINEPDDEVTELNRDVRGRLKNAKSVWKNYFLLGAVWIDNPGMNFQPTDTPIADAVLAGETRLSNATMETFTQHELAPPVPPGPAKPNCFRCHSAASDTHTMPSGASLTLPAKKINVSHALTNAFFRQ